VECSDVHRCQAASVVSIPRYMQQKKAPKGAQGGDFLKVDSPNLRVHSARQVRQMKGKTFAMVRANAVSVERDARAVKNRVLGRVHMNP
jgi:hypothetical protein